MFPPLRRWCYGYSYIYTTKPPVPAGTLPLLGGFSLPPSRCRFAFRDPRPRLSHGSGAPVADRHLVALDDGGDVAPPLADGQHLGHRGLVLLDVLVHHLGAFFLVILTSVDCVRSGVLSVNRHNAWHGYLLCEGRFIRRPPRLRPLPATVGCEVRLKDAWKEGRRSCRRNDAWGL